MEKAITERMGYLERYKVRAVGQGWQGWSEKVVREGGQRGRVVRVWR